MAKIKSIKRLPDRPEKVYDLACGGPLNSYYANGFVNHNCILWVDELEKSLSGSKSSNNTDGGTLSRVFGTLLTAMEERMKNVVTLATANDIQALPPELIRRFNEVLFVDLPQGPEREEIFNIHLKKRNRDVQKLKLNMQQLVDLTELFTGSEIEKVVKESIARAFATKKKDVSQEELVSAIKDTKPIAKVMGDSIKAIREWARDKARYASSLAQEAALGKTSVVNLDDDLNEVAGPVTKNDLARFEDIE